MKRELPWQALMSLGVPLAFVNYREASVLLENGLEGGPSRGFWSKPSLPVPMEPDSQGAASSAAQWGHPHCGPVSWHLSACRWILTSTGLSLPPLPSGHRFLSATSESFALASTFSPLLGSSPG